MHDKELAEKVRENPAELLLFEWLVTYVASETADLPVYQAGLGEVQGRNIWGLDFRATTVDSKLPAQNFIVYGTEREFH
jgi:hypothetical protein